MVKKQHYSKLPQTHVVNKFGGVDAVYSANVSTKSVGRWETVDMENPEAVAAALTDRYYTVETFAPIKKKDGSYADNFDIFADLGDSLKKGKLFASKYNKEIVSLCIDCSDTRAAGQRVAVNIDLNNNPLNAIKCSNR